MDEKELNVVLKRRDDSTAGLGFSLLDKPGFPPVIYDIEENSPAAESGKVIHFTYFCTLTGFQNYSFVIEMIERVTVYVRGRLLRLIIWVASIALVKGMQEFCRN